MLPLPTKAITTLEMAPDTNSSPPTPEATHLRSLLIGSWRVNAILAHDPNDSSASPIPVFSEQPNGGLLYAQDGYMSAGTSSHHFRSPNPPPNPLLSNASNINPQLLILALPHPH